jgi:hypothetical protein
MGRYDEGSVDSFPGLRTDHTSVLPHIRKVVSEKNSVKDLGEEGYRSLGKMLQGPVLCTVRARSLADFETPDDVLNLVRVG